MRWVMVLVVAISMGCVAGGEPARRHRWPKHRDQKDQQIEELLTRVDKLEKALAATQDQLGRLQQSKAVAAAPSDNGSALAPPTPAPKGPAFAPSPPPGH